MRKRQGLVGLRTGLCVVCSVALMAVHTGTAEGAFATRAEQTTRASSSSAQEYEGMVTDTHCGAKHAASIGLSAADCTRVCVHGGEQFALVDGDAVYVLEGAGAALKRVAGQRVRIIGTPDGRKISVESVLSTT